MTLSHQTDDRSILIIDDDPFTRDLLERGLAHNGFTHVQGSDNVDSGLALTRRRRYDLIIFDLQMPGMDGIELLRHLMVAHFNGGIVLMGDCDQRILASAERLARMHRLWCLGTLHKPIEIQHLIDVLEEPELSLKIGERAAPLRGIDRRRLLQALDCDELCVHYQPKVAIKTGKTIGVEALARWHHPRHGLLMPDSFLPAIQKYGLFDRLSAEMLDQVLRDAAIWRSSGLDLGVAVNLDVSSLMQIDLPELVVNKAREHGVSPEQLTLEITESGFARELAPTMETLTRLRLRGVGLSIDDFGTGYSTLEQLGRFPFSELKIDRSFIAAAVTDPDARAIVESSIDLGKRLDMLVVAEGIETKAEHSMVAALGCEIAQGYLFARPMPRDEVTQFLNLSAAA